MKFFKNWKKRFHHFYFGIELEKENEKLKKELELKNYEVNNFPPCAITAIPNEQMEEILNSSSENKVSDIKTLISATISGIEKHDLGVNYMLISKSLNDKFCKAYGCKRSFWGIKIVPVTGLKSIIFISNI